MLKGFTCEKTGEDIPFNECLECAKSRVNRRLLCPFDEATIAGMIRHTRHKTDISVTTLSACPRSVFIDRHTEGYSYPSSMYWAFRGQIAHKIMEEGCVHSDGVMEKRFEKEWRDGMKISGTPDLIIPSQRVLKDFKTTKAVPSYVNKDGMILAYENHRVQVNLYRWLVPYEIEEMEIVYFSMEETLICPVEIWPDEAKRKTDMTVDRYMEEHLVPLKMALDSETMPPYAKTWACDEYCGSAETCFRELKKELMAARRVVNLTQLKPKKGEKGNDGETRDKKRRANADPKKGIFCG